MGTINGTAGADNLTGTLDGDFINGLDGWDTIHGGGGVDVIDGGADNDQLYGENGNDILYGGLGVDALDGGDGSDELRGGDGNDAIGDDSGNSDKLYGEDGNDNISIWRYSTYATGLVADGGAGDDRIWFAIRAHSTIAVALGSGADILQVDSLYGTANVSLGDGQDTIRLDATAAYYQPVAFVVSDFQTGNAGDRLSWNDFLNAKLTSWDPAENPFGTGHVRLLQDGTSTHLQIDSNGGGNGYVTYLTFANTTVAGFTSFNLGGYPSDGSEPGVWIDGTATGETLTGGIGNDILNGIGGADRLLGGGGNDSMDGGPDNDELFGENGNDTLYGSGGFDALTGGDGNDTLYGGADGDALYDDSGATDRLYGEDGNDNIAIARYSTFASGLIADGGNGDDTIWLAIRTQSTIAVALGIGNDTLAIDSFGGSATVALGAGQDTIRLDVTAAFYQPVSLVISDFQTGNAGDRIDWNSFLNAKLSGWDATLNPFGTGHVRLLQDGTSTRLQFDANGGGDAYVTYLTFANTAVGNFTAANFRGYPVDGSEPNLWIDGTAAGETLTGGIGNDILNGVGGADRLFGGGGNDSMDGGPDNDELLGENGNDTLYGSGGLDVLDGGDGNDILYGGVDADFLRDDAGATDKLYGEDGNDRLSIARYSTFANDLIADGGTGDDIVWIAIRTFSTINIALGAGADTLEIDSLSGTANVSLGAGQDVIELQERAAFFQPVSLLVSDFQTGDAGDRLSWNDFLTARLTNWNGITNPVATGHVRLHQDGANTLLQTDPNGGGDGWVTYLTFANTNAASFTAFNLGGYAPDGSAPGQILFGTPQVDALAGGAGHDFIYALEDADQVTGGAGNDLLDGGAGADVLTGGNGDDIYIVDLVGDQVIEAAGEGSDLVRTTLAGYTLGENLERLRAINDIAHDFRGNAASNTVVGGNVNDTLRLQDGGDENVFGLGGNDILFYGGALTAADANDGGDGTDTLVLQGNYPALAFTGSSLVSIEGISLQGGSITRWGQSGANSYDYSLTMANANVAAGQQFRINGQSLMPGEDFFFNGAAETDGGRYLIYAGFGVDDLTGGTGNDIFFFEAGRFGAGDNVDGGAGNDAIVISGAASGSSVLSATIAPGILTSIESLSVNGRFASDPTAQPSYNLVLENGNIVAGGRLIVNGSSLGATQTLTFDGSRVTDGRLTLFGGAGNDNLTGGANSDILYAGGGADILTGGAGADSFQYRSVAESPYSASPGAADRILDFAAGVDKLDLSLIDANANAAGDQAFTSVGSGGFTGAPGQLHFSIANGVWNVLGDVTGDGVADFHLLVSVTNGQPLAIGDFVL